MFASGIYAILDADRLGLHSEADLRRDWQRLLELAVAARHGGAVAVQLRCKGLPVPSPLRAELALTLRTALGGDAALVIDDDLEAARASGAGLHLGQHDQPCRVARLSLGEAGLIGWSTHNLQQVAESETFPCDYIGFGPVRHTGSKTGADPVTGWAALADACRAASRPVVAIGGLQAEDAAVARGAGAHAMAVIGAWLSSASVDAEQAYASMRTLSAAWTQAPAARTA